MELWQILLVIGAGTIPFIVIAILVEAAVGGERKGDAEDRAVIPFDLD